jgi:hypothetical protein
MVYSCFDPARGIYDYYESRSVQTPINADLPVPTFPDPGNKIGVPSIIAGRPLPPDATRIGEGWHARGMIVRCGAGLNGFGGWVETPPAYKAVFVGAALLGVWGAWTYLRGRA